MQDTCGLSLINVSLPRNFPHNHRACRMKEKETLGIQKRDTSDEEGIVIMGIRL